MSDKDLRSQLEGLFSDIVPEPEAEKEEPLLKEATFGPTEVEIAEAETVKGEPVAAEAPPLIPAKPEKAEQERREVPPTSVPDWEATLKEQRLRILNILLGVITGVATLIIVTLVLFSLRQPSLWRAYVPYFVAWVVLLGLTLARQLNPTVRTTILIVLAYTVGTLALVIDGPLGSGGLYLLLAPLLFSVLVKQQAGAYAAAVSLIIYVTLAIAHHQGWLQSAEALDITEWSTVLNLGATFGMLVAAATFIQWMFNSALITALREAEEKHAETIHSETILRERADELTRANALLQKRTLQLQTAAQVSRAATSVLDPDELVQQAVDLIRERFDLYYVGLFLIDESWQWAVLQAGTGEAGRQMLEQDHRLEVGGASTVGWCTANAQARIALDVGEEALRFDGSTEPLGLSSGRRLAEASPLLPETRSEMALPLISRGRVIGALDVQSKEPEAFSDEDTAVLQTMADQVAVAVDNAQLWAEAQASLEEMEALQRRYVREQWAEYVSARAAPNYERTQPGVTPLGDALLPEVEQAMARGEVVVQSDAGDGAGQAALVAPISLRGEVIGALGLHEAENKRRWTDDEIALIEAVADQMALAIENARLFEQTQSRAARERLIRGITDRIRGAVDVESILQTTVQEIGKALGASHGLVRLGTEVELGGISNEDPTRE
jgi:GAF domain-containing protein